MMNRTTPPPDPIAAVIHPDPYPYYSRLVAERPLSFDQALGMWVAAGATAVTAVLTDPRCHVRPKAEPIPAALLESPAGDLFGRLVRMTDGEDHARLKQAVTSALATVAESDVAAVSHRRARALLTTASDGEPMAIMDFAFALPTHVVGSLLGLPDAELTETTRWLHDFVRCLAPDSTPADRVRGKAAAGRLRARMGALLASSASDAGLESDLLPTLAREASRAGRADTDSIVANAIGLLSQGYEATAGLIGNTLLALAHHPELHDRTGADPGWLTRFVAEVLRADPSIQNTRRFVVRDAVIAGQEMRSGDAILVLLAAANRDPAATPHPARFDVARREARSFSFGAGKHRCPGATLAMTIARVGVQELLTSGGALRDHAGAVVYRPSVNARVPLITQEIAS